MVNHGAIIIISLAGKSIESIANLLGEYLLADFMFGLRARLDPGESKTRRKVYLCIDESQRFKSNTIPSMLSELAKVGLTTILATQFLKQWSEKVSDSVMGNYGTLISFRPPADAPELANHLMPYTSSDLRTLDQYQGVVKLQLGKGMGSPVVSFSTIQDQTPAKPERLEQIRQQTRARFARTRDEADRELDALMAGSTHSGPAQDSQADFINDDGPVER